MFPRKAQKKPRTCKRLPGRFRSVKNFLGRSRPLFLAEFLKARIIPKRIEHRIEPEQRGSERQNLSEKVSLYCFGASEATIFSKRGSPLSASQKGSSFNPP